MLWLSLSEAAADSWLCEPVLADSAGTGAPVGVGDSVGNAGREWGTRKNWSLVSNKWNQTQHPPSERGRP